MLSITNDNTATVEWYAVLYKLTQALPVTLSYLTFHLIADLHYALRVWKLVQWIIFCRTAVTFQIPRSRIHTDIKRRPSRPGKHDICKPARDDITE